VTEYFVKMNAYIQDTANFIPKRLKQIHYFIKDTELAYDNNKK